MRLLKFRAWNHLNYCNKMSYGKVEYFDDMLAFRFGHFDGENPDDVIYEQYTGKRDRRGREIYEGDILAYHGDVCPHCGVELHEHATHYVVRWDDKDALFIAEETPGGGDFLNALCWPMETEIVGNVHENPEALE